MICSCTSRRKVYAPKFQNYFSVSLMYVKLSTALLYMMHQLNSYIIYSEDAFRIMGRSGTIDRHKWSWPSQQELIYQYYISVCIIDLNLIQCVLMNYWSGFLSFTFIPHSVQYFTTLHIKMDCFSNYCMMLVYTNDWNPGIIDCCRVYNLYSISIK